MVGMCIMCHVHECGWSCSDQDSSQIMTTVALVKFPFSQKIALGFYLIYIGKKHFFAQTTADHYN